MKSKSGPVSTERRNFLTGVAAAGGATVLAVSNAAPLLDGGEPEATPDPGSSKHQTYHLTDHIRDYYRSLR